MALLWYSVVVDCHDIAAQARSWPQKRFFLPVPEGNEFCALSARDR